VVLENLALLVQAVLPHLVPEAFRVRQGLRVCRVLEVRHHRAGNNRRFQGLAPRNQGKSWYLGDL
jgi:hypothetical protein